jgi:hypothetical protein
LTIKEIEDAIIETLKASDLGKLCRMIGSYRGEVGDMIESAPQMLSLPAAYVVYDSSNFLEIVNRSFDDTVQYRVVLIAKGLRDETLRSGIYEMLEVLKTTLINSDLGLTNKIAPVRPVKGEMLRIDKMFSIYGFFIETSFSLD